MRRWMQGSSIPMLFAVAGTAALVYSWSVEKRELARVSEALNRLQRSQMVVNIDQLARDQWLIALNQELTKAEPNSDFLAVAANEALTNFVIWHSHMEMRVAGTSAESERVIAGRETAIAEAKRLEEARDYPKLLRMLQMLHAEARRSNSTAILDRAFFSRVDQASAELARIEARMRLWFMLGTAMLLFGSTLSGILLDRSLDRLGLRSVAVSKGRQK